MGLIKNLRRLTRIDNLLRRKATGTPEEFGKKLGVTKECAKKIISELRNEGVQIEYCRERKSYTYKNGFKLFTEAPNLDKQKGGLQTNFTRLQKITMHSKSFLYGCEKSTLSSFSFVPQNIF